jgi:hypothetical protein
MKQIVVD